MANCRCVEDRSTGQAVFTCANVECFDWHLETENCTRLYSDRSCCSIKTHCSKRKIFPKAFRKVRDSRIELRLGILVSEGDAPLPTCLVDGKVFVEGQKFYPKAEPCKECRCKAGFEGKFEEPFCKDVSCDVELHYGSRIRKNCVPVYYGKQGCCPIDWKCREFQIFKKKKFFFNRLNGSSSNVVISANPDKDEIVPFLGKAAKTTEARCKFGDLEFQQYEELNTNDANVNCKCLTPPYLTCLNLPRV